MATPPRVILRHLARLPAWAWVLVTYLALAFLIFGAAWKDPFGTSIGTGEDPPQFMWSFSWPGVALSHLQNPFVTHALDYPEGVNQLWNCSMVLVGALIWPVRTLLGPVFTFNLVETLALATSAWTAFIWLRRHVSHPLAAAAGGALFGFSPGMLGHSLGHPHVTVAFMVPLILIVLEDLLIHARHSAARLGGLLGLMGAAQLLIGEEVLVTAVLIGILGTALLAAMHPSAIRARLQRVGVGLGVATAVFGLLAGGPLAVQFFGPQRIHGLVHVPDLYVSDLLSFITPDRQQWLAPDPVQRLFAQFQASSLSESNAYLGPALVVLLFYVAVRHWERPVVRVATILGVILAVLSLGSTVHVAGRSTHIPSFAIALLLPVFWRALPLPGTLLIFGAAWLALNRLEFLGNMLPVRLTMYVYLFAGVLLAVFLDVLLDRPRRARALGSVALAAAIIPLAPALPFIVSQPDLPGYFSGPAAQRISEGSVAVIFPFADSGHGTPMLWQAAAGIRFRMPGGYAFIPAEPRGNSIDPPSSASYALSRAIESGRDPASVDTAGLRADLHRWNVRTVIVGPMAHQHEMVVMLTRVLARTPASIAGVYVWEHVEQG